jgi:hypothetical protein
VGHGVAVGDVNGDGKTDIIFYGQSAAYLGNASGSAYVIFGSGGQTMRDDTAWAASQQLTSGSKPIDGTNGARLDALTNDGGSINTIAAGDLNVDGKADIAIGASNYTSGGNKIGKFYIYPGQASPWTSPYNLGNLCSGC